MAEYLEGLTVREIPELREDLDAAPLEPKLMEVPGVGEVLVEGAPFEIGKRLDDEQGDNFYNFQGDCGLVSVMNILTMAGIETNEDEVVGRAIIMGLCEHSPMNSPERNGGTTVLNRRDILESYGISTTILDGHGPGGSPEMLAKLAAAGYGVNIAVNGGYSWGIPAAIGDGSVDHSVVVTGGAWDKDTLEFKGLFVCDSGLVGQKSEANFLSVETLQDAYVNACGGFALVTDRPIR